MDINVLMVIIWVIMAFIGMSMAKKRGRSKSLGFFLGLILGLIGIIIIAIMGEKKHYTMVDSSSSGSSQSE